MNIALFHNLLSGGGKRAVFEWVKRLSKFHEITAYSLSTADHNFCDIRPYVNRHIVFPFEVRPTFNRPLGRINQLQRWLDLRDLDEIHCKIASEIDQSDCDVVLANTCMFTFAPAFLQYVHKPTVYYLHEPFGPNFSRSFSRPYATENSLRKFVDRYDPLIKLYQSRLFKIQNGSLHNTRLVLANSCFTQERIAAEFGVNSKISLLGIDIDAFYPISEIPKDNFIISVGEMSPRKGFDFLVESVALIPAERRPIMKLACNSVQQKEREFIENLASARQVNLEVLTSLGTDELRVLYNQAKVCVYSPQLEPFGLVPLESMACGTPVIGVREGGVQESIIHEYNGLLVERNHVDFAQQIDRLLMDEDLFQQLRHNARIYIEKKWSLDKSAEQLEAYLHQAIE